tara:strand:- start:78 stop:275 length:198 start_codon:yes stop_codon:yes gene_type:complete
MNISIDLILYDDEMLIDGVFDLFFVVFSFPNHYHFLVVVVVVDEDEHHRDRRESFLLVFFGRYIQ